MPVGSNLVVTAPFVPAAAVAALQPLPALYAPGFWEPLVEPLVPEVEVEQVKQSA